LISSILKPQPAQRATLESIRLHEWTNQQGQVPLEFVNENLQNVKETIKKDMKDQLKKLGFTESEIFEYAMKESPGPVKAAVYLLREASIPRKIPKLKLSADIVAISASSVTKQSAAENLLSRIRAERTSIPKVPPYISENRPAILSTFQHCSKLQPTQLHILKNLKHLNGHISEFDDDDPSTLYGSLKITEPSFEITDHSDPEIVACLQNGQKFEMLFKATTEQIDNNQFQTKFELLNGYDKDWVLEEFDKAVNLLLRGVS
jgi:hypothetical protein